MKNSNLKLILTFLCVFMFIVQSIAQNQTKTERPEIINNLMEVVGGDSVWAKAKGFRMLEIANDDRFKLPMIREFWIDFNKPRIKITTNSSVRKQTSILNINEGSTLKYATDSLEVWSAEKVKLWNSFWPGIPTRIFHLIASNSPTLRYEVKSNRIDFYVNDKFAVWIATKKDGTPIIYGRNDNYQEIHTLGNFTSYGPVNLWKTAAEPDGKWYVEMVDYELLYDMSKISYTNEK